MRQSDFYHLKETTHHWRRIWCSTFVLRPREYFIVSTRTHLKALKSNSTNIYHRFKSYRRPECVKTLWVTLYSEQERRWDYSWDKKINKKNAVFCLFFWMKYSIEKRTWVWRSRRVCLRSVFSSQILKGSRAINTKMKTMDYEEKGKIWLECDVKQRVQLEWGQFMYLIWVSFLS